MAVTGVVYALWTLAVCVVSAHELKLIIEIDYSKPITILQKKLVKIKLTIIRYLRALVWILPFNFGFVILFFKTLWDLDIVAVGNTNWIIGNIIFSIVFLIPLSIWFHIKLSPENAGKKWMDKLLRGNGSQVTEAIDFLREIECFEQDAIVEEKHNDGDEK